MVGGNDMKWVVLIQIVLLELACWFFYLRDNVTSLFITRALELISVSVVSYWFWISRKRRTRNRMMALRETASRHGSSHD